MWWSTVQGRRLGEVDAEVFGVSAVLVVMGLVQLAKNLGLSPRYAGVLAVLIGVVGSMGYTYQADAPWLQAVYVGAAIGLSAAGLYSGAKAVMGK
jgi:hypothetical protein